MKRASHSFTTPTVRVTFRPANKTIHTHIRRDSKPAFPSRWKEWRCFGSPGPICQSALCAAPSMMSVLLRSCREKRWAIQSRVVGRVLLGNINTVSLPYPGSIITLLLHLHCTASRDTETRNVSGYNKAEYFYLQSDDMQLSHHITVLTNIRSKGPTEGRHDRDSRESPGVL